MSEDIPERYIFIPSQRGNHLYWMAMISSQLVASLQNPKCYAHPVSQVTLVETHISWVFLTGQYVYKI
ncbi:MAG: hypothetical protein ABI618_16435, partial [Nitrospirota bacterium]